MSTTRDELSRLIGRSEASREAETERRALLAALIRGEMMIGGARVRLEWVDPKPDWIDEYVRDTPRV